MRNRFINFGDSTITLWSVFTIILCLVVGKIAGNYYFFNLESGLYLISGLTACVWFLCFLYVAFGKKDIKKMPSKPRLVLLTTCTVLFVVWAFLSLGTIGALIWLPFVVWNLIRSYRASI